MATTPTFNPQVMGQAEHALGALMNRVLAGTGGTLRQWVALNLAAVSGATIDRALASPSDEASPTRHDFGDHLPTARRVGPGTGEQSSRSPR